MKIFKKCHKRKLNALFRCLLCLCHTGKLTRLIETRILQEICLQVLSPKQNKNQNTSSSKKIETVLKQIESSSSQNGRKKSLNMSRKKEMRKLTHAVSENSPTKNSSHSLQESAMHFKRTKILDCRNQYAIKGNKTLPCFLAFLINKRNTCTIIRDVLILSQRSVIY